MDRGPLFNLYQYMVAVTAVTAVVLARRGRREGGATGATLKNLKRCVDSHGHALERRRRPLVAKENGDYLSTCACPVPVVPAPGPVPLSYLVASCLCWLGISCCFTKTQPTSGERDTHRRAGREGTTLRCYIIVVATIGGGGRRRRLLIVDFLIYYNCCHPRSLTNGNCTWRRPHRSPQFFTG